MKLKDNRGFTGVDVAVATVILMIFVSFIAALFYNLSSTSKKIERKSTATNIAINVIEALKVTPFNDIPTTENSETGDSEFVDLTDENMQALIAETAPNGYKVSLYIEDYNKDNAVKILKVKVTYKDGKNDEDVTIETLVKNV